MPNMNMHRRGRDRQGGRINNSSGQERPQRERNDNRDREYVDYGDVGSSRRVSFKGHRDGRKANRQSGWDRKLLKLLDDDDVDMNNAGFSGRNSHFTVKFSPYGSEMRRGHFRVARGGQKVNLPYLRNSPAPPARKYLQESMSHWYRVIIRYGSKYEKDFVIRLLLGYLSPTTFVPYGYKIEEQDATFFVDEYQVAEQILNADRKITVTDGRKLIIVVRANMVYIEIDDALKEKIKMVMSKRYQVATKALDLRKFHADPDLAVNDLLVPLNRPNVLAVVVGIICDSIPEIHALDLSENKLGNLEVLKPLVEKTPYLKVLHLAKNTLRHISQFDPVQGLALEDLMIDGNPVCDRFKDHNVYIREVRKRFPKVIKLDGIDLPPPITFDVEEDTKLVPSRGSFLCDVAGGEVARQFIEQYYSIFDSDSRQPLLDAYHEHAQFSLTCPSGLSSYIPDSRNLLVVSHPDKRQRLLKQGRVNIISFLSSMVKTQHDPGSFSVDLALFTPQLISLSIAGVFREVVLNKKIPIRSFNRTFIIVPAGTGFCVVNDLLFITNANTDQTREAFKMSPVVVSPPPAMPAAPTAIPPLMSSPVIAATVSSVTSPGMSGMIPNSLQTQQQQQMVTTLAMQSGMNLVWSEKCLVETNWDFDRALFVFNELNKQGSVPADAFVK